MRRSRWLPVSSWNFNFLARSFSNRLGTSLYTMSCKVLSLLIFNSGRVLRAGTSHLGQHLFIIIWVTMQLLQTTKANEWLWCKTLMSWMKRKNSFQVSRDAMETTEIVLVPSTESGQKRGFAKGSSTSESNGWRPPASGMTWAYCILDKPHWVSYGTGKRDKACIDSHTWRANISKLTRVEAFYDSRCIDEVAPTYCTDKMFVQISQLQLRWSQHCAVCQAAYLILMQRYWL